MPLHIDSNLALWYTVHMSTAKTNIIQRRFAVLAALGEVVFHVGDLANLWNILDKNTLHTTLKRYAKQGLIHRVFRGLYAIKPIEKINPFLLGTKVMHEFSYISTETVLEDKGIIMQDIGQITIVSSKSKNFSIADQHFRSRQLADIYLFNPLGIEMENGVRTATLERAIADMLYFNPRAHFDARTLIDWKKVKKMQKEMGYSIIK